MGLMSGADSGTIQYLAFDDYYNDGTNADAFDAAVRLTYDNMVAQGKGAYPLPGQLVDPLVVKLDEPVPDTLFYKFMAAKHPWVPEHLFSSYTHSVARFLIDQNWDRLVNHRQP